MDAYYFLFVFIYESQTKSLKTEMVDSCREIRCSPDDADVCGIREEGSGYRVKLFGNECELIKYGCDVDKGKAYGLINIEICEKAFSEDFNKSNKFGEKQLLNKNISNNCFNIDCNEDSKSVCALRQDGSGFKALLFENTCHFMKFNCENDLKLEVVEANICHGIIPNISQENKLNLNNDPKDVTDSIGSKNYRDKKNGNGKLFVVNAALFGGNNVNETVNNFFAATHIFDMPMREIEKDLNETSRRMLIKYAGPVKVFEPWVKIPKNISEDYYHYPTLASCYHRCPSKCPDTYAPVCGVAGVVAREPALMFQNHCYMDVAQCKMKWENKSPTASSSNYIESTFLFCLGDELSSLYRFLPLVRTLQRMGRLKKKGYFRYKFRNMKFFNNLLSYQPKLMG